MRIGLTEVAVILLVVILVVLSAGAVWLYTQEKAENATLKQIQAVLDTEADAPSTPPVESKSPSVNPHAEAIATIEADAGMRLSRNAQLALREEGDKPRPYGNPPHIGIGRNLRGNGVSVSELHAIAGEIDYPFLLQHTHIENGRVYIATLDLANRIFTKPLTEHDITLLLTDDLNNVRKEAIGVFGQAVWQSISELRREAILDVMFNLGLTRFKGFVNFIGAVKRSDWDTAASELLLSEAARENIVRYHRNAVVIQKDKDYFGLDP